MSNKVYRYELETVVPVSADLSENNELIVETAGFIPLDVKFKRFEQAGIAAQFNQSEFTANDIRQLYANPDFELYPDDEFEEVQEKIAAYQQFRNEYLQQMKGSPVQESKPGTSEAEKVSDVPEGDSEHEKAE